MKELLHLASDLEPLQIIALGATIVVVGAFFLFGVVIFIERYK